MWYGQSRFGYVASGIETTCCSEGGAERSGAEASLKLDLLLQDL
jgi:hypothetical protein